MKNLFYEKIQVNPIIAAVNSKEKLNEAIKSPCEIIFLLKENIIDIEEAVKQVKLNNKAIYVHVDLIDGLSKDAFALKYINKVIKPDGIITTRPALVKVAKELNMFTIQRLFILDSLSLKSGINTVYNTNPNVVEILPGIMDKITKQISEKINVPIITGGLISDKEDVIGGLKSGSIGVSSSNEKVWYM